MATAGRGRPPLDLAHRLRAACFHSAVVAATGWSNERLDQYFVDRHLADGDKATRVFQRMGLRGTDPDAEGPMKKRGFSVVQKVAEHSVKEVAQCAEVYRTLLWDLLQPPRTDYGGFKHAANRLFAGRGQLGSGEEVVFALHANDMRDEELLDPEGGYQQGIRHIAESATFDALALLCALHHEARFYHAHRFADCVESYLPGAHLRACARYNLCADAVNCITTLITVRLIHDRWDPRILPQHRALAQEIQNTKRRERGLPPLPANSVWSEIYTLAEAAPSRMFTKSAQRRVIRLSDD